MKAWVKYLVVTIVLAVPAFILGPILWPPSNEIVPTATQLPFFIALSAIEALIFGLGVGFLIFEWRPTSASFWAISWLLVSWWPHDNLHIHNALEPIGLLKIEYGFHVTLIIASLIIAYEWAVKK